jgi:UDP-2-acetamido-2,6-beta-L-arabino-hexul-4-ose reductase
VLLYQVDFIFHLVGINRRRDSQEFFTGKADLTRALCNALAQVSADTSKKLPVVFASSIQADRDSPYGQSKRLAEQILFALATFCHNITRDRPIQINEPIAPITLVYVDDVVSTSIAIMGGATLTRDAAGSTILELQYQTTAGEVADLIRDFGAGRLA